MAYSLISHIGSSLGLSGGTSGSINTTGADFLLAAVVTENNKPITFSDSKSNAWRSVAVRTNDGQYAQFFYCFESPIVGTGHTITVSTASGANAAVFTAWSGRSATVDPLNYSTANSVGSGTTVQNMGFTPSSANQLVVTACMINLNETSISIDGGFTIIDTVNFSSGVSYGISMAYLVQTSAAAASPTWTRAGTTSGSFATAMASFRPDGSTGAGGGGAFASACFGG